MMKWLSVFLKVTLAFSVLSLFAGSEVSITMIVAQALAVLSIDVFAAGETGTVLVEDIKKYIKARRQGETATRAAAFTLVVLAVAFAAYAAPSFCADNVVLPELTAADAFTEKAGYMSLEGFVMHYCKAKYNMDLTRAEARDMIKGIRKAEKKLAKTEAAPAVPEVIPAPACEQAPEQAVKPAEGLRVPDVRGLKAFTDHANFMSLEGYVITYCRVKEGVRISREDARRIIKKVLNLEK